MADYRKIPLGVLPSKPDRRDYSVAMFTPVKSSFPTEFILSNLPLIYDQGQTSMCVAFTCAAIKESQEYKERGIQKRYSPGFIYANRKDEDYTGEGMYPREALKNLVSDGVSEFNSMNILGSYQDCYKELANSREQLYTEAKPQIIASYVAIQTVDEVKTALTEWGPVLLAIAVYDSFYQPGSTGIIPAVSPLDSIKGYHAMTIVGWKLIHSKPYWIVHNSWGKTWGNKGVCYIPFDYKGISEMWSVTDYTPHNATLTMEVPMTVIPPGYSMAHIKSIYAPLNATVEWGRGANGKVWVKAIVPPYDKSRVVTFEQDSKNITITENI